MATKQKPLTIGKNVTYRTSVGTEGKGKITDIATTNRGAWVTVHDKSRDKVIKLRPAQVQ